MSNINQTDWTQYYEKKRSFFSTYTQRFTLKYIKDVVMSCKQGNIKILELGGGGSCFAEDLCRSCTFERYDIVDNNELAVKLFNEKQGLADVAHRGYLYNLLDTESIENEFDQYDFVYSVGLIEHFNEEDRKKIIKAHFTMCKEGGTVFITFPTPTLKYRFWRGVMELLGLWQFHDEIPLIYDDVGETLERYGEVQNVSINKKLFLTQLMVTIKKAGENA